MRRLKEKCFTGFYKLIDLKLYVCSNSRFNTIHIIIHKKIKESNILPISHGASYFLIPQETLHD